MFGHAAELDQPLWFLATQLIITVIIFVIYYVVDNDSLAEKILAAIAVFCIVLQYSGMNLYLFGNSIGEIRYTFGFLPEVMPVAIAGLFIGKSKKTYYTIIVMVCVCVITYWLPEAQGFGYQGIYLACLSITICLVMIKLGEKIHLWCLNQIINQLARYTMGVYCIHWLILKYLTIFYELKELSISRTIVFQIYAISLLIAIGIGIVGKKVKWLVNMIS